MLPYLIAVWLFLAGLYGIVTSRHWIHLVICLSVLQSSTYVLLLTIGYRLHAGPPVFYNVPVGTPAVDPIVQALMLTDVVVEVTLVAVLLALVVRMYAAGRQINPYAAHELRG